MIFSLVSYVHAMNIEKFAVSNVDTQHLIIPSDHNRDQAFFEESSVPLLKVFRPDEQFIPRVHSWCWGRDSRVRVPNQLVMALSLLARCSGFSHDSCMQSISSSFLTRLRVINVDECDFPDRARCWLGFSFSTRSRTSSSSPNAVEPGTRTTGSTTRRARLRN